MISDDEPTPTSSVRFTWTSLKNLVQGENKLARRRLDDASAMFARQIRANRVSIRHGTPNTPKYKHTAEDLGLCVAKVQFEGLHTTSFRPHVSSNIVLRARNVVLA